MTVAPTQSRIGSVVGGRYRLLAVLGRGGMGVLFSAEHLLTGRRVALKVLRQDIDADEHQLEQLRVRFFSEARAAAAVSHKNIVDVLDMGTDDDGAPFLALELLEGRSLERYLAEHGPLSPELTLKLLLPIVGALAQLHDIGIVHRDIKPSNIFVRERARGEVDAKLLDFGLAHTLSDLRLTRSGMVMGTPLYMAPEHAAGDTVGPAADVWSLGIVLFECLTGELPFKSRDPAAIATQVMAGSVRSLLSVAPRVPPAIGFAIGRALRRDLSLRYADMRDLARGLAIAATTASVDIPSDPDPVGLPDFQAWYSASSSGETESTRAATPVPASSAHKQIPSRELASTPPIPAPKAHAPWETPRMWAASALLLLTLGAAWWIRAIPQASGRASFPPVTSVSLPKETPPPAAKALGTLEKETPSALRVLHEAPLDQAEPVAELPEKAPRIRATLGPDHRKVRTQRPLPEVAAPVAPSPPEAEPPKAPAATSPLSIEADWR